MRRGLAALCAAVALGACGADPEVEADSLTTAAGAIEAAGAVEFVSRSTSSRAEMPSARIEGVVDVARRRARIQIGFDDAQTGIAMEQLIVGGDHYFRTRVTGPGSAVLGDRKWQRVPASDHESTWTGGFEPTRVAEELRKADDVRRVGREEILGEMTTHYTGRVSFHAVYSITTVDAPATTQSSEGAEETAQIDVWIDDDGLPRRQVTTTRFGGGEARQQTDYLRYGVDADFRPPPATEVE